MALRETGSILVNAPRDRVLEILHKRFEATPGGVQSMSADRIQSRMETFVLQDAPTGTRIVLGRTAPPMARRDDLRRQVALELLALQKLVE